MLSDSSCPEQLLLLSQIRLPCLQARPAQGIFHPKPQCQEATETLSMARQHRQQPDDGSWLLVEELLERGDDAFVDELRRVHDADRLGAFAARWYADQRPLSRKLLLDYLARPLNAYRHEALVKRLFKLAEQTGDDEVLGHFLVLF